MNADHVEPLVADGGETVRRCRPDHDNVAGARSDLFTTDDHGRSTREDDTSLGVRMPMQSRTLSWRRVALKEGDAGFGDLRVADMAVLQFPSPDGVRPGMLAERAGMSKQAMNQLLRSLEALEYLARSDAPDEGRARIVHMTKRGHAAYAKMQDILREIEREWRAELGAKEFAQLKALLARLWESTLTR